MIKYGQRTSMTDVLCINKYGLTHLSPYTWYIYQACSMRRHFYYLWISAFPTMTIVCLTANFLKTFSFNVNKLRIRAHLHILHILNRRHINYQVKNIVRRQTRMPQSAQVYVSSKMCPSSHKLMSRPRTHLMGSLILRQRYTGRIILSNGDIFSKSKAVQTLIVSSCQKEDLIVFRKSLLKVRNF